MGKLSNIVIAFGDNKNTFNPNELITGHVVLQVHKPIKILSVVIKLHGECKTKWYIGSDKDKTYKEKEQYCLQELGLWGGVRNQTVQLSAGNHQKEFSFQLPANCPSSFVSKHGSVYYHVRVTCKISGNVSPFVVSKMFNVYDIVDLTRDPTTSELFYRPAQIQGSAHDECCCCNQIDAKIDLTLDKSAYAPGDKVVLNGYIDNKSNRSLSYSIILRQRVTCYGRRSDFSFTSSGNLKSIDRTNDIVLWQGIPIVRNSRKTFSNQESLSVPTIVASCLRHCKFISVSYFIIVKSTMMSALGNTDLTVRPVDIVIGHRGLPDYSTLVHPEPTAPPGIDLTLPDYESSFDHPLCTPSAPAFDVTLEEHGAPPTYLEATESQDAL